MGQRLRRLLESDLDESSSLSYLETSAVAPGTAKKYRAAVRDWRAWALSRSLPLGTPLEVDTARVAFFNKLFLEGENPWRGELVAAGMMHVLPEYSKAGQLSLPRTLQC